MQVGGSAPTGAARSQQSWSALLESSTSLELSSGFAGPRTSVARKPSEPTSTRVAQPREAKLRDEEMEGETCEPTSTRVAQPREAKLRDKEMEGETCEPTSSARRLRAISC
jgi:hypothetical protein